MRAISSAVMGWSARAMCSSTCSMRERRLSVLMGAHQGRGPDCRSPRIIGHLRANSLHAPYRRVIEAALEVVRFWLVEPQRQVETFARGRGQPVLRGARVIRLDRDAQAAVRIVLQARSEEHTSELQS